MDALPINDKLIAEIKVAQAVLEDSLHDSIVTVSQQDLDLKYTHFFNTHRGMAGSELLGMTDADWLPAGEADRLTEIKKRALAGKKGARELFKTTLSGGGNGGTFYNIIQVEPIKEDGKEGKVVGIYTIAIDITDFQKAVERLEVLNGRLLEHLEDILNAGHPGH